VAYDGSEFEGWQRQPERRTVQGVLEEQLAALLGEPVKLTGAGRTDSGCHARGQTASLVTDSALPAGAWAPCLNRALPADVRVRAAHDAAPGFDARRSALARRYAYRLLRDDDLMLGRFAWRPPRPVDPDRLARATAALAGEHDFTTFQATGSTPVGADCCVHRASWRAWDGGILLDIIANRFLYHMVRSIVGTALAVHDEPDPGQAMARRLRARQRSEAGVTAPAHGLCLEQVFYPADATG
jgi:tRNA pseudouridine38-40 synthase